MIDLRFDGVSKRYRIRSGEADARGGGMLARAARRLVSRPADFWAVRDVSFEVRRGEAMGIIGHNGAGKSTVLKLLSSITAPTLGEITLRGRLSALIEVGSGFHPELTGRENVFLNGSILGMPRREIARKLDSILAFAGVERFADTPVKRFSSGMYVRLGFSIAAHLDPDVLLLDEVLAVGDAAFQEKCLTRIDELRRAGTTIVFISHDLGAVERLCDRALLLDHGRVAAEGTPREVIAAYERGTAPAPRADEPRAGDDGPVRITGTALHAPDGAPVRAIGTGSALTIRLSYLARETVQDAALEIFFVTAEDDLRCHLTTELSPETLTLQPGAGTVEFTCPALGLQPGLYKLAASIKHRGGPMGGDLDHDPRCAVLRVDPGRMVRGDFYTPQSWRRVAEAAQ